MLVCHIGLLNAAVLHYGCLLLALTDKPNHQQPQNAPCQNVQIRQLEQGLHAIFLQLGVNGQNDQKNDQYIGNQFTMRLHEFYFLHPQFFAKYNLTY